ncbi:RdgB/HAM1 family non-canonical purine NTP pyrophosphatase [Corynebacterium meitnerae]|uniref:dITP/XTP pyrophosphatase n=1 Tax=Corynebacterium meitnerae TaxID=2913498 RepID=A0A9X3LVG2_9CORY|nr:RdgB/HAM1 family non-canonical purine NTP pyrophosphatase [Corynebacterium meitnerae]MCZ9293518.1 RdgB/HAM1 family non-canonical purine NTP pyrophosphatase [Corynebacterium meitnerae]
MKILVASGNAKKLRELETVLAEFSIAGVELVSLKDVEPYPEPPETGLTFEENALIKARAGAAATGLACVADDSGIAVEALNGMPGVLSARWSGDHGDDQANNDLLLAQMSDIDHRAAAFVSCCALDVPAELSPDGQPREITAEGRWEGALLREPRGENGFGYDPLFEPADCPGRSSAELSPDEKNERSHRGAALRVLAPEIAKLVGA